MTETYMRRGMMAALILIALALAEAVIISVLFPRDAAAHEAPPSEIVVTTAQADRVGVRVTFDLRATYERIGRSTSETDRYDLSDVRALAAVISRQMIFSAGGEPVPPETEQIALEGDMAGSVAFAFDVSGRSGGIGLTPGQALGDSLIRMDAQPVRYTKATGAVALTPGAPGSAAAAYVLRDYIFAGFVHIIPKGLDHILFVAGLFLLSLRLRPLLIQVSLFTLAHSVTLALGALGLVRIPGEIVEPLIAASIVFIAAENIMSRDLSRWRPYVVFGFGLLHGLGFAGVLAEFGLPEAQFVAALIGFNIGVELGQLFVLAVCFAALGYWFSTRTWYRSRVTVPASLAVGLVGLMWTVERVGGAL